MSVSAVSVAAHASSRGEPTDEEKRAYQSALDASEMDLAAIKAAMEKLEKQRESLESAVITYRAILSPIRQLPRDMLQEIFIHCLPDEHRGVMSASEAPLLLGRVCSLWREIVYSTPALWSSVHGVMTLDEEEPELLTKQDSIVAWMERSKAMPISFSMAMPHCPCCMTEEHTVSRVNRLNELMAVFAKYSDRFRRIELRDAHLVGSFLAQKFTSENLAQLQTLGIRFVPIHDYDHRGHEFLAPFLSMATNLRKLSLITRIPDVDALSLIIPAALVDLRINTSLPAYLIAASLRRLPQLVNLSLSIELSLDEDEPQADSDETTTEPLATVNLPKLQALTVYSNLHVRNTAQILSAFAVPRLQHLSCQFTGWYSDPNSTRRNAFLPPTPLSLQSLSIDLSPSSDFDLQEYLTPRRNLSRLRVIEPTIWASSPESVVDDSNDDSEDLHPAHKKITLLEALTINPDLCPNLEQVEWPYYRDIVDVHAIIRFIESRLSTPLREVLFGFCSNISSEDETLLQEYARQQRARGVNCTFDFPYIYCPPSIHVSASYGLEPENFGSRFLGGADPGLDWPGTTF